HDHADMRRLNPRTVLVLRLVFRGGLLWILVTRIGANWSEAIPDPTSATVAWLIAAFLLTVAGIALSAVRWSAVLTALDVRAPFRRLLGLYLAGQFMSNILPSTIGGDALRVSRLSRQTGDSPTVFASVVLERLTGWIVLPVITLTGLIINPGLRELGRASALPASAAMATLGRRLVVVVLTGRGEGARQSRLGNDVGWRRFTGAVRRGIRSLARLPSAIIRTLVTGFAYQLLVSASA